ncbi:MAG: hypothetical protein ACRDI2_17290, partial [Chloroflexota bacterium]
RRARPPAPNPPPPPPDRRTRWIVERTLAWRSKGRALLVRYAKQAANHLGRRKSAGARAPASCSGTAEAGGEQDS